MCSSLNIRNILPGWKKEWTGFVFAVIFLRLFYAGIGWWVVSSGGPIPLNETIYGDIKPYLRTDLFSQYAINPWFQWDTISFLKIAITGYQNDATVAFMPLYPLLIRWLGTLFWGDYLLAALILSSLCAIVTLILLYELFRKLYSAEVALQTVLVFLAFPTAFYLLAGYTESLYMTLVLAFWIFAQKQKWWLAGMCAGLATLTRFQGVILSVVLLWMIWPVVLEQSSPRICEGVHTLQEQLKSFSKKLTHPDSIAAWLAALIPLGVAISYQAWLSLSGYEMTSAAYQKYWHMEAVAPWTGILRFFQRLPSRQFSYMDWIDLGLLVVILIAAVIGSRRIGSAFSIYVWLNFIVLWMRWTPHHLLGSYSRYFLVLFPLFVLPALSMNRHQRPVIIVVSFSLHILLVTIFLWGSWVS